MTGLQREPDEQAAKPRTGHVQGDAIVRSYLERPEQPDPHPAMMPGPRDLPAAHRPFARRRVRRAPFRPIVRYALRRP
ncbi:hypothetical protein Are01nite_18140 [Actinoplanes regularis]|nr:hypothetical protein Are01nite_18140 [Actinoplanes regularis]